MKSSPAADDTGRVLDPGAAASPSTRADAEGNLFLGPRVLPVPRQLSPQAKQAIAAAWSFELPPLPDRSADVATWRKAIADREAAYQPVVARMLATAGGTVEKRVMAGVTVYRGVPDRVAARYADKAILYVRGGAFVMDSEGRFAEALAAVIAALYECVVFSVNYRTPPDHPFPAAVDDVVAAYRELLKGYDAKHLAMMGLSAGGSIAPGAALKLRDQGLPLPAMMLLESPLVDLTEGGGGDSYRANAGIDSVLRSDQSGAFALYVGGHDRSDPYLSPLFGDFTKGFPPTLITTGTRDLLLSNSVLMHRALRRADIPAELHVVDAMSHGGFKLYSTEVPEDDDLIVECRRFLNKYW